MSVTEADVMLLMGEQVSGRNIDEAATWSAEVSAFFQEQRRREFVHPGTFRSIPAQVAAIAMPMITFWGFGSSMSGFPSSTSSSARARTFWQESIPAPSPPSPSAPSEPPINPRQLPVPIPPEPPPPLRPWGLGPILTGIGALIWEGWPNELGSGERRDEAIIIGQNMPMGTAVPDPGLPAEILNDPNFGAAPPPPGIYGDPYVVGQPPAPKTAPKTPGEAVADPGLPPWILQQPGVGPPPAPVYAPAPAPTPAPTANRLPPWLWTMLTGIGSAAIGARSRSTAPQLYAPEAPAMPNTAGMTNTGSLTAFNAQLLTSPQTATAMDSEQCQCRTKRKPGRKCTARARVIWASGRKKGKPAGTRCIARERP